MPRKPSDQLQSTDATSPQGLCPGDRFLNDRELATRWNCSPKTLRNQRSLRRGCPYFLLGRLVRYRLSDVLAFEEEGKIEKLRSTNR